MQTYSVTFINNSQNAGSACLYQQNSGSAYNVMSLAWLVRPVYPGSQAMFQWTAAYSFAWAQTGMLMPGITFAASQQMDADPTGANMIPFSQQYGSFQFGYPRQGAQPGTLAIQCDASIPPGQASVGTGMSGSPAFATQAYPNMVNTFTTNSSYWFTFGNYQQGQVLDTNSIGNAAQLNFGPGSSITVTLNPDGSFTVQAQ